MINFPENPPPPFWLHLQSQLSHFIELLLTLHHRAVEHTQCVGYMLSSTYTNPQILLIG